MPTGSANGEYARQRIQVVQTGTAHMLVRLHELTYLPPLSEIGISLSSPNRPLRLAARKRRGRGD
jgi:hypothetical protein